MPSEGHASPQQTAAEERAKANGRLYVKTQKLAFFGRIKHPESLEKGELEAKEKKAERQTTRLTITRWRPKCFRKGYESAIISYRSHSKTHRKLLFRTFCQAKRTPQMRYRKINFREDAAISSPHEPATRMNTAQKLTSGRYVTVTEPNVRYESMLCQPREPDAQQNLRFEAPIVRGGETARPAETDSAVRQTMRWHRQPPPGQGREGGPRVV